MHVYKESVQLRIDVHSYTYDIQVYFYYFSIDSRTFNKSESLKSINIWLKWNFVSIICNCRYVTFVHRKYANIHKIYTIIGGKFF